MWRVCWRHENERTIFSGHLLSYESASAWVAHRNQKHGKSIFHWVDYVMINGGEFADGAYRDA